MSYLPSELRQVRRDGIHLFDLTYWSDALARHTGRKDGKVVVRYDTRNLEIPPVSLWEYREAMKAVRALGRTGSNELVIAELIRRQRQIECESRRLAKAKRRSRERKGTLKGSIPADLTFEGLRPVDTDDTSHLLLKVERW